MEHSLTKFGFDPRAEAARLQQLSQSEQISYLSRELESHEVHVIRDHVVSIPYYYWLADENRIFTDKEKTNKLELDERERGGYFEIGIPKAIKLAKENPNRLVFLYSPIGPASFDNPPHPDYAKSYKIGQLYLMYSDGERISNISISLDQQGEEVWLREIFGKDYLAYINNSGDEIEKITKFITNPVLTQRTIDDFLSHLWSDPDTVLFHNDSFGQEEVFTVADVMDELRKSLTGKLKSQINVKLIAAQAVRNGGSRVKPEDIDWAYKTIMGAVMKLKKVDQLTLGGACQGSVVKSSDLFGSNPVDRLMKVPNLSSTYRQIQANSVEDYKNDPNLCKCGKPPEAHFHCLNDLGNNKKCQHPIIVGEGTTKCPDCGKEAVCK